VKAIRGYVIFLAISATLSITLCRLSFHPFVLFLSCFYFIFLYIRSNRFLFKLCITTFLLYIGIYVCTDQINHSKLKKGDFTSVSTIVGIPSLDGNSLRFNVKTKEKEEVIASYIIKRKEEKEKLRTLKPGDTCLLVGELVEPKAPTMPHAFDYKQYLYDHHIHWKFNVEQIDHCQSSSGDMYTSLLRIRMNGLQFIENHYSKESIGVVQALLFGERSSLQQEIESAYQQLGIVHLLAISGLHVGLLVGGIYFLFIYFGLTHEKTKLIMICVLPLYIIMTGAAPSVIRASLMVILYFTLKLIKRDEIPLDVISVTYLFLLAVNPYYLFQVGFQLSFAVSFGLLLSATIITSGSNQLIRLLLVSFISQVCSLPLLIYHFYEFSFVSLIMNMLFVPFYSFVILPLAIFSYLVELTTSLGEPLIHLFNFLLESSHHVVLFVSSLSFMTITTGRPTLLFLIIYLVGLFYLFKEMEAHIHVKGLLKAVLPFLLCGLIQFFTIFMNPNGQVLTLDVGQGDSIFIKMPYRNGTYLIDTGGRVTFPQESWQISSKPFSLVESITMPYLKSIGVTKLTGLILTHGDYDHIGEALHLMDRIKIEHLIIPKEFARGDLEREILTVAKEKDIKIVVLEAGDVWNETGLPFHAVSPSVLTESKNDDSLVLLSKIGGLTWLFTGDAEIKSEKKMLQTFPNMKIDVLKLGHHGSKGSTSEELLDITLPSLAIVSAGYQNRYQHPHQEVVDKLIARNIPLLRTDLDGSILYKFKGDVGTFHAHPPYDEVSKEK